MAHKDIYETFKKIMPMYAEIITEWFPNGKGSIRVRVEKIHQDFVFTYHSCKDWRFETINSFINNTLLSKKERNNHEKDRDHE